jgi:hypothetical protein
MVWFAEGQIRVSEIGVPHDAFDCVGNFFWLEPLSLFVFTDGQGLQGAGFRHSVERSDILSLAVMRAALVRRVVLQMQLSQAC